MRRRTSSIAFNLSRGAWFWTVMEEWEGDKSHYRRTESGEDKTKEEAETTVWLIKKRWESEERDGMAT